MRKLVRNTDWVRADIEALERELTNNVAPDYGYRGTLRARLREAPSDAVAGLDADEKRRYTVLVK